MTNTEKAVLCFDEGNTCSQAILSTFGPQLGLDYETALKIACPFGGGIAKMGALCGAVSGAFMVIGLKYGRVDVEDQEAREKSDALVKEFILKFKKVFGSIICHELLDFDQNDSEGLNRAKEEGLTAEQCPEYVRFAAKFLEQNL